MCKSGDSIVPVSGCRSLDEQMDIYNASLKDKYYVPEEKEETVIDIPETCVCQISENNIDGFIVTVWRNGNGKE